MPYIVDFQPLAKVERITGLSVVLFEGPIMVAHDEDGLIHWEARFHASRAGVDRAAKSIIDRNYRRNCEIVRKRRGGKCARCGRRGQLQTHHKLHRGSHGRMDVLSNLESLCFDCHRQEHGG